MAQLSHRAFLKGKLRRKVHAGSQAKRVSVQHGIKRIEELVHAVKSGMVGIDGLRSRWWVHWLHWLHWWMSRYAHGQLLAWRKRLMVELLRVRSRTGGVIAGILIFKHVGMRIVLLFCTDGINLGRT